MGERDGRAGDRGRLAGSRAGMGGLCSADELRHDSDTSATAAADGICRAGESIFRTEPIFRTGESRIGDVVDAASLYECVCG